MKILHTSDWHLGHILYGYDRSEEQQSMLDQVIDIVGKTQPDVFLLSGDVYHTPQPSSAVQTMFAEALVRIHQACPEMEIIVTAGNHDSGAKHEIFRTPWRALKVHAIGSLDKDNIDNHIINIADKGFVIAVPYVNERNLPEGLFSQLISKVEELNDSRKPVVMMAHTTMRGCDAQGHDNITDTSVGGIDAFPLEAFGSGYDYLALGHIHHAQHVVEGQHAVRYSGTPLDVSFDENYPHSVTLVEIDSHETAPRIEEIAIENPRPLVTLPTSGAAPWDKALALLRDFPDDIPAYIRLSVSTDGFLPVEASAEAQAVAETKACHFCHINIHRPEVEEGDTEVMTVEEFRQEQPIEIIKRYCQERNIDFDDDLQELFSQAVAMVEEDSRNQ